VQANSGIERCNNFHRAFCTAIQDNIDTYNINHGNYEDYEPNYLALRSANEKRSTLEMVKAANSKKLFNEKENVKEIFMNMAQK